MEYREGQSCRAHFFFEGEGEGGLGNYKKNILAQQNLLKKKKQSCKESLG